MERAKRKLEATTRRWIGNFQKYFGQQLVQEIDLPHANAILCQTKSKSMTKLVAPPPVTAYSEKQPKEKLAPSSTSTPERVYAENPKALKKSIAICSAAQQKMKSRQTTSAVWKHFTLVGDGAVAKCNYCGTNYRCQRMTNGNFNQANMKQHLRTSHPAVNFTLATFEATVTP